ncbi:MAG TPA: hypothetical protein PKY50_06100 [Candidatus Competibacter sp.]|nr:hypothetical protein [Candidatus Competibacter sp.]
MLYVNSFSFPMYVAGKLVPPGGSRDVPDGAIFNLPDQRRVAAASVEDGNGIDTSLPDGAQDGGDADLTPDTAPSGKKTAKGSA